MTFSPKVVAVAALAAALVLVGGASIWWVNRDDSSSPVATATGAKAEAGDVFDQNEPEFDDALRSFYQEFLEATDLHRTPDDTARQYGSGLAELAEPPVVATYDAWRAANEEHGDSFQRVDRITSVANILDIKVDGAKVTIRDCTDEREESGMQEVNSYVTRVVDVANHGGLYRVTRAEVRHEGRIDSPGYGCIPAPMAKEAADTVKAVGKELAAAEVDPRQGLRPALDAVVSGDLQRELTSALAKQAAQNISITSPTEAEVTVLGLDPRGLGVVAAVEACVTFPDGVVLRKLGSGEVVREALSPGTQDRIVYAVRLNDTPGPAVYSIISEAMKSTC